ncbi:MAG: tRNA (adenosine(37)-N6)-threonylcarbamoyltransferase complex dimerization subunit type 1 TsaB [Nitrospirae bacterium]|nr:tRNA (adenosine(37)-N6)-threonylcarbamoyltransferase complex dimerization subunit type 1 TsaB [Nitrospirota bacterium]
MYRKGLLIVLILAVETATACQSVAVMEETTVLGRADHNASGSHTRSLIPTIKMLLKSLGIQLSDFQGLAVSIGPGSFTGLRVGLATLIGFRLVTGAPLVAVPTLEAMAWNLYGAKLPLCPTLRARVGEVYWAQFTWRDNRLVRLSEDRVGPLTSMAASIKEPTVIFGEGLLVNRQEVLSLLGPLGDEPSSDVMAASAVSVALASLSLLKEGKVVKRGMSPRYVQRPEAELQLARSVQGTSPSSLGK